MKSSQQVRQLSYNDILFDKSGSENERYWGNAKPPSIQELVWIKNFGRYPNFNPTTDKLSNRLSLQIAKLKEATRIVIYYHYLHRGRTMAQLPYWILIDELPIGVLLFSLPRLSVPMFGIEPMNLLELARLWIHPDVQDHLVTDSTGKQHSLAVASCAVAKSLKRVQRDWYRKYPDLPNILAVISWADNVHHEGTIYRACNFQEMGQSGGTMHGSRNRPNGGRDKLNDDYKHLKTTFLYRYKRALSESEKHKTKVFHRVKYQLSLF